MSALKLLRLRVLADNHPKTYSFPSFFTDFMVAGWLRKQPDVRDRPSPLQCSRIPSALRRMPQKKNVSRQKSQCHSNWLTDLKVQSLLAP